MFTLNRFVPDCNNKYIANVFGEIVDVDKGVILAEVIDDIKYAKMDWYDGYRYYEVGFVVLIVFIGLAIPINRWNEVEVGYMDGDKCNTIPSNIYYTFRNPIKTEKYPEFYHVPYFTRYAIRKDGSIINVERGNEKKWFITKPMPSKGIRGGYRITQIYNDRGERSNLSRHRALALTFIPCPGISAKMVVNHKNGVGGSDWLKNLEWVTHSGNVKHAYDTGLYSSKVRIVLVKEAATGVITRYQSIAECCSALNIKHPTLTNRLRNNPGKTYTDGFAYKLDDDTPWVEGVVKERQTYDVIFRNVFTNETFVTNNQREASDITGVDVKAIWYHISIDSETPIKGFLFRKFEDGVAWPEYDKVQLNEFRQSEI